ncbi:MAG: site-2 protease family protein, partial [Dehalococcoidia bacterium]|nr:site-2 protease family protein [Dehalococcoidia bacterium]
SGEDFLWLFLFFIISINILLGIFNLIPIAPLDGFKVAVGLLPRDAARALERVEPYGPGILMALIAIGFVAPQLSPLRWFIGLVYDDVFNLIL